MSESTLTLVLFIVAGFLVGGAWTAYQSGSKVMTVILGLLAVVATAGAVMWMLGAME